MDKNGLPCACGVCKPNPNRQGGRRWTLHFARRWRRRGVMAICTSPLADGRSYPTSLRPGKMALARLDLHACRHRLGVPRAVPQPRPFLPRCRGPVDRLAVGERSEAVLRRDGRLTARRATTCPRKPVAGWPATRAVKWTRTRPAAGAGWGTACWRSTARRSRWPTPRPIRRSIRNWRAKTRLWLSHRADRRGVFAVGGHGAGRGDRQVPGQADRGEQFVPHAA